LVPIDSIHVAPPTILQYPQKLDMRQLVRLGTHSSAVLPEVIPQPEPVENIKLWISSGWRQERVRTDFRNRRCL